MNNPEDIYDLKWTTNLNHKEKLAHYKTPDYCITTKGSTLDLLKLELEPLCAEEGFFYRIYRCIEKP